MTAILLVVLVPIALVVLGVMFAPALVVLGTIAHDSKPTPPADGLDVSRRLS